MADLIDNVEKLKRYLQDQGYALVELENGLQVQCDSGHFIEINALTRDSDYFWASFETKNTDPEKRRAEIASVREPLAACLFGVAELGAFEKTQDADARFVYVANVELDPSVAYYGAIDIDDLSATEPPEPPSRDDHIPPRRPVREQAVESRGQTGKASVSSKSEPVAEKQTSAPLAIAREALAKLETIDNKMLRKSLDMMNLRRSSNIRLMLTRIFRSAVEPEELMRSIRAEAEKIVSADDHQQLEMVRMLSADSFLEPVVNLLCREVTKRGK